MRRCDGFYYAVGTLFYPDMVRVQLSPQRDGVTVNQSKLILRWNTSVPTGVLSSRMTMLPPTWHSGVTEWHDECKTDVNHILWPFAVMRSRPNWTPEGIFGLTCGATPQKHSMTGCLLEKWYLYTQGGCSGGLCQLFAYLNYFFNTSCRNTRTTEHIRGVANYCYGSAGRIEVAFVIIV